MGSFSFALATRLVSKEGIAASRSRCETCRRALNPSDLVPLLSYLATRGRCRYCGVKLSVLYPAAELAAVVIAVMSLSMWSGVDAMIACALGWGLLALALADLDCFQLPDALTIPLIVTGILRAAVIDGSGLTNHVLGAILGFGTFYAISHFYRFARKREGLGLGDAKLLAGAGAWLGWTALPSVVLLGGSCALAACAFQSGRLRSTTVLPFGAWLSVGFWLVYLYGPVQLG